MNLYIYLAIAIASAFGSWQVQEWRYGAQANARMEAARTEQVKREKTIDSAADAHESDKSEIRTVFRTVTKEVARVVEKPIYRNVCFDDDGLRSIATAISGTATSSVTAPAVPRPQPAR